MNIDVKQYVLDSDYQYLEIQAVNGSVLPLPASIDITGPYTYISNPQEYKVTIEKIVVNINELPMFNSSDRNLLFTVRSLVNNQVYFGDVNYPDDTNIYNVNDILTLFNTNLVTAINTIQPLIPGMPAGGELSVTYDYDRKSFTFYISSSITPYVTLCLNTQLRSLFRSNYFDLSTGDYCLVFTPGFNNENIVGSYTVNRGTYSPISSWYNVTEILLSSNSFDVTPINYLEASIMSSITQLGDKRRVLAAFSVDINYEGNNPSGRLVYIPTNPRIMSFCRRNMDKELRHINLSLEYRTTNDGNPRRITTNPKDSFEVLIKFTKAITN